MHLAGAVTALLWQVRAMAALILLYLARLNAFSASCHDDLMTRAMPPLIHLYFACLNAFTALCHDAFMTMSIQTPVTGATLLLLPRGMLDPSLLPDRLLTSA